MTTDAIAATEKSISQADDFAVIRLRNEVFNMSISGTWTGTVTLQRSFNGQDWFDVEAFTLNDQKVGDDPEKNIYYRIGFKVGDYGSGTALVRISQ